MSLNNCRLCGRVYQVDRKTKELCFDCMIMHEAQYKVTLHRIEKRIGEQSFRDIAAKLDTDPHRVQVYLANRFGHDNQFVILDGNRKGYCYICNTRVYYSLESACLDCLQHILAVMENRPSYQSIRINRQQRLRRLRCKPTPPPVPESALAEDNETQAVPTNAADGNSSRLRLE